MTKEGGDGDNLAPMGKPYGKSKATECDECQLHYCPIA